MSMRNALMNAGLGPFGSQDLRVLSGSRTVARCNDEDTAGIIAAALTEIFDGQETAIEDLEDGACELETDLETARDDLSEAEKDRDEEQDRTEEMEKIAGELRAQLEALQAQVHTC